MKGGSIWHNISGRKGHSHQILFLSQTRCIDLLYSIRISAEVAFVLSFTRLSERQTDGRTDGRVNGRQYGLSYNVAREKYDSALIEKIIFFVLPNVEQLPKNLEICLCRRCREINGFG